MTLQGTEVVFFQYRGSHLAGR